MQSQSTNYGWLDTNVFIHALCEGDLEHRRSAEILYSLENDEARAALDPLVVHELTYVLPRVVKNRFCSRQDIFEFIAPYLALENIYIDQRQSLIDALRLWAGSTLAFVDAYLRANARVRQEPNCSANRQDFGGVTNTF